MDVLPGEDDEFARERVAPDGAIAYVGSPDRFVARHFGRRRG